MKNKEFEFFQKYIYTIECIPSEKLDFLYCRSLIEEFLIQKIVFSSVLNSVRNKLTPQAKFFSINCKQYLENFFCIEEINFKFGVFFFFNLLIYINDDIFEILLKIKLFIYFYIFESRRHVPTIKEFIYNRVAVSCKDVKRSKIFYTFQKL